RQSIHLPVELVSERRGKPLGWPRCPLESAIDAEGARRIDKLEEVRIIATRTLYIDVAGKLVFLIQGFVQSPLDTVLMCRVHDWNLIVVARVVVEVGQRKQIEK